MGGNLESNKAYGDQANALGSFGQEQYNYVDTYVNKMAIGDAYTSLSQNQESFDATQNMAGSSPFGMTSTPLMRADLVNFVNDESIPFLNLEDVKNSLQYGLNVMKVGVSILQKTM